MVLHYWIHIREGGNSMPLSPLQLKFRVYRRGESITSLAKKLGVTREWLSKVLNGNESPGPDLEQRLCEVLGIRPSKLPTKKAA